MTNESLQKEIKAWQDARKNVEELVVYHGNNYGNTETAKESCSHYGRPASCKHNELAFDLLPKLVAEVEFLNRVVSGLVDETAAAETVLRLERENKKLQVLNETLRKGLEELQDEAEKLPSLNHDLCQMIRRLIGWKSDRK